MPCVPALLLAFLSALVPIQAQAGVSQKDIPQWVLPPVQVPQVSREVFFSASVQADVSYEVYLPAAYALAGKRQFPILYWLHGTGGGEKGIPQLVREFDQAIRKGDLPPLLIVFPNGLPKGMWVDSKDGSMPIETLLVQELLPEVESHYRVIPGAEGRLCEGFSMGGYGVARLAFRYPEMFAGFSVLSGGPLQEEFAEGPRTNQQQRKALLDLVYGGDMEYFRLQSPWALAEECAQGNLFPKLQIVIGARDEMLDNTLRFHDHLFRLGLEHHFKILPSAGHHTMELLRQLGDLHWSFLRECLGQELGTQSQPW